MERSNYQLLYDSFTGWRYVTYLLSNERVPLSLLEEICTVGDRKKETPGVGMGYIHHLLLDSFMDRRRHAERATYLLSDERVPSSLLEKICTVPSGGVPPEGR